MTLYLRSISFALYGKQNEPQNIIDARKDLQRYLQQSGAIVKNKLFFLLYLFIVKFLLFK